MIRFGIEETISIEEEVARIEWSRIKDILNGKEKAPINIRGAGRNSSSTNRIVIHFITIAVSFSKIVQYCFY